MSNFPLSRPPRAARSASKAWYGRRDELHLQRAKLRSAVLMDAAIVLKSSASPETVESAEDLVRTVMCSGVYETFAAMGRDLEECAPKGSARRSMFPSLTNLIAFLLRADAILGEYPR